jgi:hypothetical protein
MSATTCSSTRCQERAVIADLDSATVLRWTAAGDRESGRAHIDGARIAVDHVLVVGWTASLRSICIARYIRRLYVDERSR